MADLYQVGGSGSLVVGGKYDPGITQEIDRQIRNMPMVVQYLRVKAQELLRATGSENFEIVLSTEHGGEVFTSGRSVMGGGRYMRPRGGEGAGTTTRQPEKQRPRAYVAPANGRGIHEELTEAVLLKAALSMSGK